MKLYTFGPAANAQRVRLSLAEKRREIPAEEVNVREGALLAGWRKTPLFASLCSVHGCTGINRARKCLIDGAS